MIYRAILRNMKKSIIEFEYEIKSESIGFCHELEATG